MGSSGKGASAGDDFLKIDVEGAEKFVVAGGTRCLREHRPAMIVETSDPEFLRIVRQFDYRIFQVDPENILCLSATALVDFDRFDGFPEVRET